MNDQSDHGPPDARIAAVALNLPLDRTFDYLIPPPLRGRIAVGSRLTVPFGAHGRVLGYCVGLHSEPQVAEGRLKAVLQCLDEQSLFTPVMMKLARWMADHYRCSAGEALNAMLPGGVRGGRGRRRQLVARLAVPTAGAEELAERVFDESKPQSRILRALAACGGEAPLAEVLRSTHTSRASAASLERKGHIVLQAQAVEESDPLAAVRAERQEPFTLTDEQRAAYDTITGLVRRGRFDVVLLHGVTSSGKTEVYLHCIADVVAAGKQAIVLVPEISLTPQTVRHFSSRFERVAVLHSRLTEAERRRQWETIRAGGADVVIGARSAIFAPVPALGLLVIDEEHENSFKQDSVPRYHARDVAITRARLDGAPVVLGSATPSLESYYNAQVGAYTSVRLRQRIGGHPLPPVEIVDMRQERAERGRLRVISRRLEARMRQSLDKGEQVLLFINRRGYAPFVHCPRCGFVLKCSACDITLNYHRQARVVECHYCGRQERPPERCPECALEGLRFGGTGTERVEAAVAELFPERTFVRMDSDTTRARRAHQEKLDAFRTGRSDILIGTQMIAKGLDFPNVTTVGVVNADVALHLPDFRCRERTFQLVAQVAGRTGRGPAGGRVIVQTFMPDEPSIRAAARHDYEGFAVYELPHRRELGYPPYGRLARIIFRSRNLERLEACTAGLGVALRRLCEEAAPGVQVLGPAPAPVAQVRGWHRRHLLVKAPDAGGVQQLLGAAADLLKGASGVQALVDVDPVSML